MSSEHYTAKEDVISPFLPPFLSCISMAAIGIGHFLDAISEESLDCIALILVDSVSK